MKDIKSYVIGFLSCACLFLIMGHSDNAEEFHTHNADDIQAYVTYYNAKMEVVGYYQDLDDLLEDLDVQNRNCQNDIMELDSRISDLEY